MRIFGAIFALGLVFLSCKSEPQLSDQDQINREVKNYLFLDDSIAVDVTVEDTMYTDELEEMLATLENNMSLIQQDLDTLSLMIDEQAYKKLDYQNQLEEPKLFGNNKMEETLLKTEKRLLELKLKQWELRAKKLEFKQTNRVLLHLQRSMWANIAGFNVDVTYPMNGAEISVGLLLDANYRVID